MVTAIKVININNVAVEMVTFFILLLS